MNVSNANIMNIICINKNVKSSVLRFYYLQKCPQDEFAISDSDFLNTKFKNQDLLDQAETLRLTAAALSGGAAVVAMLAALAGVALGVVQALEAGARSHVAGAWVVHVDVAVALTHRAAPAGHQRVPKVARGALITPGA